jgi:hypothetical protein
MVMMTVMPRGEIHSEKKYTGHRRDRQAQLTRISVHLERHLDHNKKAIGTNTIQNMASPNARRRL